MSEHRLAQSYFGSRDEGVEAHRKSLELMLTILDVLRPLIESEALRLVPAWKLVRQRQKEIEAAIRHDLKDDNLYEFLKKKLQ